MRDVKLTGDTVCLLQVLCEIQNSDEPKSPKSKQCLPIDMQAISKVWNNLKAASLHNQPPLNVRANFEKN
jgi:hypothetical protein